MTDLIKAIERWQKSGTEGPWTRSGIRSTVTTKGHQVGRDGASTCLVFYSDRSEKLHLESLADADLIAAAPDMAKALLAAVDLMRVAQMIHDKYEPVEWGITVLEQNALRNVLDDFRKAMGGE